MGWHPIETMPYGRYVLVFAWHLGHPVMALRTRLTYRDGGPSVSSSTTIIYGSYKCTNGNNWRPTHWMELPDPPPATQAPTNYRPIYQELEEEARQLRVPVPDWPA